MTTCKDPFKYFIDYAEWFIQNNPGTTFSDVLNQLNVFPYSSDLCCPGCGGVGGQDNIYILSGNFDSNEPGNFFSYFLQRTTAPSSCCTNTHVTQEVYEIILSGLSDLYLPNSISPCCSNSDIKTCIKDLSEFLKSGEFDQYIIDWEFLHTGIAEFNTIDFNGLFCKIYDVLSDKEPEVALNYIMTILQLGLVICCKPEGIVITSIDTYVSNYPAAV